MQGVTVEVVFIMSLKMQQGFHAILLASVAKSQSTPWDSTPNPSKSLTIRVIERFF